MHKKSFFLIIAALSLLFITSGYARAQSPDEDNRRFELGAQVSALNLSTVEGIATTPVPCLVPPCPVGTTFERSHETELGFGGRIGYNITNYLAIEAEANFFPSEQRFYGGRAVEGLFGVKAGWRFEKAGVFGKVRPGFFSSRQSEFGPKSGVVCIAVFPPPASCFDETFRRKTDFAVDVGGVIELYPTSRMIVRFDAGDTIIRIGQRSFSAPSPAFPVGVVVTAPPETSHNFQGSIGMGFRF
jgi:Outer membrane protein beta-barrel domain